MDSKKIRALMTITECSSITAAAEKLGYTQPGLTNMMNALEQELGLELLVRSKRGARLSPSGEELLPYLEQFLAADEELSRQAEMLAEKNNSSLRLGAYASVSKAWLPSILAEYKEESLRIDTIITVTDIRNLYSSVKDGSLDCAMVSYQPELIRDLTWVPLRSDELVAVLPDDYEPQRATFPLELFDDEEFLMPSFGFDMDILPALNAEGRLTRANIRYTNLDDSAIVSMVAHKLGYSILSRLVMQYISDHVRTLPLDPPAFRQLGIICSAERSQDPEILKFISCAEDIVRKIYG